MKLILVRHGETYANLENLSQGHLNSQLTAEGIEQAEKVSERLRYEKIDVAFSSDLDRALDTCAKILNFHKDVTLIKTPILREQAKGIFEGKPKDQRAKLLKKDTVPYHEWHPEGGERLIDVWDKLIPFFEKIKSDYADKHVLIVSHGCPIACILSYLHGKKVEDFNDYLPRKNTAVSIVEFDNNKPIFRELNCAKHI